MNIRVSMNSLAHDTVINNSHTTLVVININNIRISTIINNNNINSNAFTLYLSLTYCLNYNHDNTILSLLIININNVNKWY